MRVDRSAKDEAPWFVRSFVRSFRHSFDITHLFLFVLPCRVLLTILCFQENCASRYIKMTQRVGLRFAEHQAMQQKRAAEEAAAGM